jgi:hypothetical protein
MGKVRRVGNCYSAFDDMCWPIPSNELDGLEWRLRYSSPTKSDLLVAASVISAYRDLVGKPRRLREKVVKNIRRAVLDD